MSLLTDIREQQFLQIGEDVDSIEARSLARLLNDINSTAQSLYSSAGAGAFWGEGPQGNRLKAPATLTVGLTVDSKTVTGSFSAYMHGCSVQVGGEWNRLFQTGASTWELLIPAAATNAAALMIVYHDCLNLTDASIAISRLILDGYGELGVVNNLADLETPGWSSFTVGRPVLPWWRDREIDTPRQYAIDGTMLYGGSFIAQIRFNPVPDKAYAVHWTQREKFSKIASWADTRTTIIPHDYHESVFIPLVLEKLLKHPGFEGDKDAIEGEATLAREIMTTLSEPQRRTVRISTARGY